MKKSFLSLCLCLAVCGQAYCQSTVAKAKSFLSSFNYDLSVGLGSMSTKEPFDIAKIGFQFGLDARKDVKSFGDKTDLYGLVGVHVMQNGGKQTAAFDSMRADDSFSYNELAIPIRVGASYKIKSVKVFLDLGPFIGFRVGGDEFEGLENKSLDFGVGGSFGCRFKRTAISFGLNYGFPTVATYENVRDSSDDKKYNLNTMNGYFSLAWTLGKKHKD